MGFLFFLLKDGFWGDGKMGSCAFSLKDGFWGDGKMGSCAFFFFVIWLLG